MFDLRTPWTPNFDELRREMDRYLEHISQHKPRSVVFSQRAWQPAMDMYETEQTVVAVFDLAGVAEDAIQLVVARDSLTIQGERSDAAQQRDRRYTRIEIPSGPFERVVQLPSPVNPDGTAASYRAGFLEVTMPKLSATPQRVAVTER